MKETSWSGCYDGGWKGIISDASYSHPAKFSRKLIQRIYQHATEQGWIRQGSVVVDPFGGVALGSLDAMLCGCTWVGCELEPRFHRLGNENIDAWTAQYGHVSGFGRARLLNGDSRRLCEVVGRASDLLVSSPPYAHDLTPRQVRMEEGRIGESDRYYGQSPGQLGTLREGDIEAVVSSPPFLGARSGTTASSETAGGGPCAERVHTIADGDRLGSSPGQLGAMPEGSHADAVVSSPPFAAQQTGGGIAAHNGTNGNIKTGVNCGYQNQAEDPANLGTLQDETFWSASRLIISQCYDILRPGGHAIWVTKRFVRKGQIVEFSQQWARLCESLGFKTVCWHRAMLVKELGTHTDLYGDTTRPRKERKSFFRRLCEKRGSPPIDYEDVICMVKPDSDGGGLADVCVTSPPFVESIGHDGGKDHMPKIGNFAANYGQSHGQLGNMKEGKPPE